MSTNVYLFGVKQLRTNLTLTVEAEDVETARSRVKAFLDERNKNNMPIVFGGNDSIYFHELDESIPIRQVITYTVEEGEGE